MHTATPRAFAFDESGATAVDWAVLSAATLGVGLAVISATSSGLNSLSGDISTGLSAVMEVTESVLAAFDFETGIGTWLGGVVLDVPGFGNMLVLDGQDNAGGIGTYATIALDPNAAYAEITFDLAFVDSWDNENAYVYINGTAVALGTFTHLDHPQFGTGDVPPAMTELGGVTVTFGDPVATQGGYFDAGHAGHYVDYTQPVTLVIETGGASEIELGFGTTLNSSHTDESLGIDNIQVISTETP
ncbi:Flp family type IVb pilin [Roseicyclus elongatus]|nr:hypothetical protein [Roseibacterium elongatum]